MTSSPIRAVVVCAGILFLAPRAWADTATIYPSKDNTLYENNFGSFSNGIGDHIFSGRNNSGQRRRAVMYFNVAANVPGGSTVSNVTLRLNMSRANDGSGARTMKLQRLLADWGEGESDASANEGSGTSSATNDATWKHRFYNSTNWATLGGDFAATISASTVVDQEAAYTWGSTAQLVADVQDMLTNPGTNYGWILIGDESVFLTAKRFDSKDLDNSHSLWPRLTVTYTPPVPVGACCFANGTCTVLTSANCSSQSGTYQGNGTSCSPNPCPQPTGACCFNNGTCSQLSQTACTNASGAFQGSGTACTPGLCPVVLTPFVDPLPMPGVAQPTSGVPGGVASYRVEIQQFQQQLHTDLPPTTLWGYYGQYPGPTFEAMADTPITVDWVNDLREIGGALRTTHYLPVETCLHGAENLAKTVTHLHGGHIPAAYDGHPDTAFTPGNHLVYEYGNRQLPATLWTHDHSLGMTRLNVMMGLASFYLIRDTFEQSLGLPDGIDEIPLAIQDRTFNPDGSLKYLTVWDEHFFGDTMLVNGKVWPYLNVRQGKYRFRLLNGCNSRVLTLALSNGASFSVIGSDGGLLPAPITVSQLTFGPGERYDVVMDFASYSPGTQITMTNSAPAPHPGTPGVGVVPNVMKFIVTATPGHTDAVPGSLRSFDAIPEGDAVRTREFILKKQADPCTGQAWMINGLGWDDITEYPKAGETEIWSFINQSTFTHPMHVHLVMFQILDRQNFTLSGNTVIPVGPRVAPPAHEAGWKDTVLAAPNQITRVIMKFTDYTGLYPYHCHILEHEDHEMMRQFSMGCTKGDLDQNLKVDGRDISLFASELITGGTPGTAEFCAADMNDSAGIDEGSDLPSFVDCVLNAVCP